MDLTRLYNLTTPELREEAERLGITDTYAMSRGKLIQAIRAQTSGTQQDGFLGKVFGFAKWALQAAGETTNEARTSTVPTGWAGASAENPTEPGEDTGTGITSTASSPDTAAEPETETATEPTAEPPPEPAREPETATEPEAVTGPDTGPELSTSAETDGSQPDPADGISTTSAGAAPSPGSDLAPGGALGTSSGSPADSGPPSRPPAGVFSRSSGLFEEPFPTRTMARILADQGHYKRSLAIYARLLDEEPDDGELSAEAEAVRTQARSRRSHAPP